VLSGRAKRIDRTRFAPAEATSGGGGRFTREQGARQEAERS
jgi:hypothetical protein